MQPPRPPNSSTALASLLTEAWSQRSLVKIVLSAPLHDASTPEGPLRLKARPIQIRSEWKLSVVSCFSRRETTQNHHVPEGFEQLAQAFVSGWREAHLYTLRGDFLVRRDSLGRESVRKARPTFLQIPNPVHDKPKPTRDELSGERFLHLLGVTQADGKPRAAMAGKLRQITRFVELLGHLLEECAFAGEGMRDGVVRVADMGAGKGYLTFALAWMLRRRGWRAEVVGVELRPELVRNANVLCEQLGWSNLRFEAGSIQNWEPAGGLDVLVALHACDTATDDALFKGIRTGASLLVTSPCCHKEIRPQLTHPAVVAPLLQHGILQERFSEMLTDAMRALLLEREGYAARVFEFVEPEHSGKNLMLSAVRRSGENSRATAANQDLENLRENFGIRTQRLLQLLDSLS